MDYYTQWINQQAGVIEAGMRDYGRRGMTSQVAVWCVPSKPGEPGRLHIGTEAPFFGADIVRFPAQGSRVMAVPYSHLRSLLWHACRSLPILPID
jgi:hypothetical protein